jgi:hypothetical protein
MNAFAYDPEEDARQDAGDEDNFFGFDEDILFFGAPEEVDDTSDLEHFRTLARRG